MSNYHQRIMNIQPAPDEQDRFAYPTYRKGHKDARHAAAEIAAQADAEIAQLKADPIRDASSLCIFYVARGLKVLLSDPAKAEEYFLHAATWRGVLFGESLSAAEVEEMMQPGFDLKGWVDARLQAAMAEKMRPVVQQEIDDLLNGDGSGPDNQPRGILNARVLPKQNKG